MSYRCSVPPLLSLSHTDTHVHTHNTHNFICDPFTKKKEVLTLSLSLSHTHTHTGGRACTNTQTHTHTDTDIVIYHQAILYFSVCLFVLPSGMDEKSKRELIGCKCTNSSHFSSLPVRLSLTHIHERMCSQTHMPLHTERERER